MDPATDGRIRDGLCACFPPDRPVFSRTRAWHGSAPSYSVLLEDGGRLVAHAGIVDRTVRVADASYRVAGVQNVFVLPPYRGRALSARVLTVAMEEAERRGMDCGLLFCVPALQGVYQRAGWRALGPRRVVRVDDDGCEKDIPAKNVAMLYPLRIRSFGPGRIHLMGNDW
jgi:GNAT superfamily N-acetyltransferase